MARDLERPVWKGQRPWFEIWFAVVLDASRRRALWIRDTLFVSRQGDVRAQVWGAWFDADAPRPARAAKRRATLDEVTLGERGDTKGGADAAGAARAGDDPRGIHEPLIRVLDSTFAARAATGAVDGLQWDVTWDDGRSAQSEVPAWLPARTRAEPIVYDADARGQVVVDGTPLELRGRATAMHLWGKRRVPTLQWIWAPWIDGAGLEVQAVSLRDTFSLGFSTLRLDAPDDELRGRPATAAHPTGLVTSTVAGARRMIHARAWAEPAETIGYAYRDTDGRDLMAAHSDLGSAQLEVYTRTAPGVPWKLVSERRSAGGVAVEIHQHAALPEVEYLAWDELTSTPRELPAVIGGNEDIEWPEVTAIVALGLTYGDHVRETGRKLDPKAPPTAFVEHPRALAVGDGQTRVPDTAALLAALDDAEPGLAAAVRDKLPVLPAVMDYEGELAVIALGPIDDAALAAGAPQPFGIAAANDLTARVCQVLGEGSERTLAFWTAAKSFPGFLPVARRIWAPAGGLAKLPELTLETRVNGSLRQQASTRLVMYDLAAIVRAASAELGRPLGRGDVILTGTPSGVGLRLSPLQRKVSALIKDRFRKAELLVSSFATSTALLRPGDVIEVDAGPAGRVRTRLVV